MIKENNQQSNQETRNRIEDLMLSQTGAETVKGGPQSNTLTKTGCGTLTLTGSGPTI